MAGGEDYCLLWSKVACQSARADVDLREMDCNLFELAQHWAKTFVLMVMNILFFIVTSTV
jgi:hypothetical protein